MRITLTIHIHERDREANELSPNIVATRRQHVRAFVSCALGLRANCQAANQENVGWRVVIERRRKIERTIVRETKEKE